MKIKINISRLLFSALAIHGIAQAVEPIGPDQVSITNATNMPLTIRAARREANASRWHNITADDAVFSRGLNVTLSERDNMTRPFVLQPGQTRRLLWLESWKFDLLFAPVGSDFSDRIQQGSFSVTKKQAMTDLHKGYWGNVEAGTRIILYYLPSKAAKNQLLKSDAAALMGEKAGQQKVALKKVNMAVIYEIRNRLSPAQAEQRERNFINTVRVEIE